MINIFFPILIGALAITGCAGSRSVSLEEMKQNFFSCPDTPNCVSSQAADTAHQVEPLHYTGSLRDAKARLIAVIESMPRSQVVRQEESSVHATFTSRLLRFTDDVEFHFDDETKVIHVRSASRVGYYDFGVNRRRVEWIRTRFLGR